VVEDLVQTTFLQIHRARASYRPELPLRSWIFTIAAAVRSDELRRRYRRLAQASGAELEHAISEEPATAASRWLEGIDRSVKAEDVRAALDRLPESLRVVVHLHCYQELTFEQIAEMLSTTPGAVRTRASRAYERLREELRAYLG
jgi:RNA polymerase sigma-70 factor (ECF subfamily)